MDIPFTWNTIGYAVGAFSIVFSVYSYFRNPQIQNEQKNIKLVDRVSVLEKVVVELREKQVASLENDLKQLNITLQELSKTVVRLSTIIDERIPKSSASISIEK